MRSDGWGSTCSRCRLVSSAPMRDTTGGSADEAAPVDEAPRCGWTRGKLDVPGALPGLRETTPLATRSIPRVHARVVVEGPRWNGIIPRHL